MEQDSLFWRGPSFSLVCLLSLLCLCPFLLLSSPPPSPSPTELILPPINRFSSLMRPLSWAIYFQYIYMYVSNLVTLSLNASFNGLPQPVSLLDYIRFKIVKSSQKHSIIIPFPFPLHLISSYNITIHQFISKNQYLLNWPNFLNNCLLSFIYHPIPLTSLHPIHPSFLSLIIFYNN